MQFLAKGLYFKTIVFPISFLKKWIVIHSLTLDVHLISRKHTGTTTITGIHIFILCTLYYWSRMSTAFVDAHEHSMQKT